MKKNWKQKPSEEKINFLDTTYEKFSKIHNIKDINKFMNPSNEDVHSAKKLLNIRPFIERVEIAIRNKEKIAVVGDCDFD